MARLCTYAFKRFKVFDSQLRFEMDVRRHVMPYADDPWKTTIRLAEAPVLNGLRLKVTKWMVGWARSEPHDAYCHTSPA